MDRSCAASSRLTNSLSSGATVTRCGCFLRSPLNDGSCGDDFNPLLSKSMTRSADIITSPMQDFSAPSEPSLSSLHEHYVQRLNPNPLLNSLSRVGSGSTFC